MTRIFLFCAIISISFVHSQNNTSGYVIYKVNLTEGYKYSDNLKFEDPEFYKELLVQDSIINNIEIGVVFNKTSSKSFNTKPYINGVNPYFNAMYKINTDAEYFFDTKSKISNISKEFWLKDLLIKVDSKGKWEIDLTKSKIIDGHKCFYARYKGQYMWAPSSSERVISAWFTTEIPLPYGPLHYSGLPGLIIELNDDNVRFTAIKIAFDNTYLSKLKPIDTNGKDEYTEQEFIQSREDIRRKAKRIMIGG
uniref:GLPGLI family protein n=1 Tax=Gelidibacter sp. TaxID=2018083 RepID=UPI004048FAA5